MVDFRFYLITDRSLCSPRSLEEVVRESCSAGVRAIQLREKDLTASELAGHVAALSQITSEHGANLWINRHASPGLDDESFLETIGGCGVHLPDGERISAVPTGTLIGMSVHSNDGAVRARSRGAAFLTFGPVFETPSKVEFGPPQGLKALAQACSMSSVPIFAVGGIVPENAKKCIKAGAHGVAVVGAVMKSDDIGGTIRHFESELGSL